MATAGLTTKSCPPNRHLSEGSGPAFFVNLAGCHAFEGIAEPIGKGLPTRPITRNL